jgi:hypothetical protein
MDFKVSRKETRLQPEGPVEVLVSSVFDLYPVFASDETFAHRDLLTAQDLEDAENLIVDVEILDDDREERLDRAMFALVKQRGMDPIEPDDGIQWAEAIIGEVISPVIIQQARRAVSEEGLGVRVTPGIVKGNLTFKIDLIDKA